MEDLVGALGIPGLVEGDGLTVAHRVAHDHRERDSEGEHKENRANAHGCRTKEGPHAAIVSHLGVSVRRRSSYPS